MSFPGVPTTVPNIDESTLRQHMQLFAATINRLNSGKMNAVIDVTLADGVGSTVVTDSRLSAFSAVFFDPMTANAAAEIGAGTMYVTGANRRTGQWTITHANNAQTDRQFKMGVIG